MRRSMIERETNEAQEERLILTADELHLDRAMFQYSYAPVPGHLFRWVFVASVAAVMTLVVLKLTQV